MQISKCGRIIYCDYMQTISDKVKDSWKEESLKLLTERIKEMYKKYPQFSIQECLSSLREQDRKACEEIQNNT
jgi:hypothetical protein